MPGHLSDPRMIGHVNPTCWAQHFEPYSVGNSTSAREQKLRYKENSLLTNLVWQIEEATRSTRGHTRCRGQGLRIFDLRTRQAETSSVGASHGEHDSF